MTKDQDQEGYQGWTNRPTWVVNLWLSNDEPTYLYWRKAAREALATAKSQKHEVWTKSQHALFLLEDRMKEELRDQVPDGLDSGVYRDLLNHVMDEVDYKEIAQHWLDDAKD